MPVFLIAVVLLALIFTPLIYDVRVADDEIRVELLHRYTLYRVPLEQIQAIRAERRAIQYLPLPLYTIAWHHTGATFINRRFCRVVPIDYAEPLRRSTINKVLYVSPKNPSGFIAAVRQRRDDACPS